MVKALRVLLSLWVAIWLIKPALADEWNLDIGLGGAHLTIEPPSSPSYNKNRPFVQVGVHRVIADDWRIGTGAEWLVEDVVAWGNSTNILNWRLGDLDYRMSDHFAINTHVGIARYYREHPSYGYSYGAGIKYQLGKSWYLAVDLSSADVDISTGVPAEDNPPTNKNDLKWASFSLHLIW